MTWDVDGNGRLDALTDGGLIVRYLFGLTGEALTRNAIAPNAARRTADQITEYLRSIRDELDIDGNGNIDALTDGILYLRYLLGFTGEDLTSGAVARDATRRNAEQIVAYLLGPIDPPSRELHLFEGAFFDVIFNYTDHPTIDVDAVLDRLQNTDDPSIIGQQFVAVAFNPSVATDSREVSQIQELHAFGDASFDVTFNLLKASNQPPVAADDFAAVELGTTATIDVLANDRDPNGDDLLITGFSSNSLQGGAIASDGNGLRYTPADGFRGTILRTVFRPYFDYNTRVAAKSALFFSMSAPGLTCLKLLYRAKADAAMREG